MQDALTGYMITALARLGDALFMTAGIVVGILAGLQIATVAGATIELRVDVSQSFSVPDQPLPIAVAVAGAALSGACLTIASYGPLRSVGTAAFAGGLGAAVFIGLGSAGFGQVLSTGVAAIAVGFFATLISIRRKAPALVTATAGITPLLPGLAVFRAVFAFAVEERFDDGLAQMLAAGAVALAIGSGVVLGEFIGAPLRYGAGRIGGRFRMEEPPGIRRAVGRVVRLRPAKPTPSGARSLGVSKTSVALEPASGADAADP
jgi:uncharacterized membrane protein YjjB (DUF3815 family)